jgi:NADP-dependent 3-hydroxy acid dehydrogenase YdfG
MSSTTAAEGGRLQGRTALITGASRGIGWECARALHAEGATLVLLARDLDALARLATALGSRVRCVRVDLAAPHAVDRVLETLRGQGDAPDIIVSNAADFFLTPVDDTAVDDFARALQVNLTAHFAIVRAFLPDMKRRGRGHLVTIGSIADRQGLPGNAAYSASKFGLRALHEVLREELRGSGIRASLVSPARVDTTIWEGNAPPGEPPGGGDRSRMLPARAVADAVRYVVTCPPEVDVEELRLARA